MHGSICLIVKKFVDTRFGGQTWQTILNNAGCSDLVISPIETYPDEAVMAILESACEELEIELATALYEIGRFAAAELIGFSMGRRGYWPWANQRDRRSWPRRPARLP